MEVFAAWHAVDEESATARANEIDTGLIDGIKEAVQSIPEVVDETGFVPSPVERGLTEDE